MVRQKTDKELIQDYLGGYRLLDQVAHVTPLPPDRRRGRNYIVELKSGDRTQYRVYFNQNADGTHYVEEME